jgi:branched-chain amino acid transport system ATP-binding protein
MTTLLETAAPVLAAESITVRFGGLTALGDVSVQVPPASIVGLIGPNGAGKSTLLGVLSGDVTMQSGAVSIEGADVSRVASHQRVRRGLARTFQLPELYGELTVRQHLSLAYRLADQPAREWSDPLTGRFLRSEPEEDAEIVQLLHSLGIESLADRSVAGLPLGAMRLVEIGRALATGPKVLLLDEPSSGLNPEESKALARALTRLVESRGISMLLVEHDTDMVFSLSAYVYVLDFGTLIASGRPAEVQADARVQSAYLGETKAPSELRVPPREALEAPILLEVSNLVVKYGNSVAVDGVSLIARQGSVTALLGANGAGKSTVARALSRLVPVSEGSIAFDGIDITGVSAHRVRRLGLAYLPEGRGIFPTLTVSENLRIAVQTLPKKDRSEGIDRAIQMFPILGERRAQVAGTLSGGQQQMLSLARIMAQFPRLIIADEISLGLAPLVVDDVFAGLQQAIDLGVSVILIEQFIHRALELASTCYILRRGRVVWSGQSGDAHAEVLDHYLGSDSTE